MRTTLRLVGERKRGQLPRLLVQMNANIRQGIKRNDPFCDQSLSRKVVYIITSSSGTERQMMAYSCAAVDVMFASVSKAVLSSYGR